MWDWTESRIACSWHSGSPFNSHQLSSKNLAGSRQIHFLDSILFTNSQCNRIWEGWVWSANATSVLSRPPKRLILDYIVDILQLSELNPFGQNAWRHHEFRSALPFLSSSFFGFSGGGSMKAFRYRNMKYSVEVPIMLNPYSSRCLEFVFLVFLHF